MPNLSNYGKFRPARWVTEAVKIVGSQEKLGKATGYSQHAIFYAIQTGHVPPLLAYRIHAATRGRVKYIDVCPLLDIRRQLDLARKHVNGGGQ